MKRLLLLVGLLFLFIVSPVFAGKPLPPPQLEKIFSEVVEIEDALGEENWQKSLQVVAEIDDLLLEMASSLHSSVAGVGHYQELSGAVARLRSGLERKDATVVFDALLVLQKQVFRSMDFYNYAVHPAFAVLQKYVNEAIEAAEVADFERVIHEMKEVANVVSVSARVMEEKGVGKGMRQDYIDQLVLVVGTATAKKQDATIAALKKMKLLSDVFVWMGQQQ